MNHPFPSNLPLLRRIYGKRFSEVRFLIPFERMPDADVITVYRGSYNHSTFLTDARQALSEIDCDYYVVIHDDVLLNPKISEETFQSVFDLGPDDGFIAGAGPMYPAFGQWVWDAAFLPSLLFPKSLLFGTGVEAANLLKYLPSASRLAEGMAASGADPRTSVRLDPDAMSDIARLPAHTVLHGLAFPLSDGSPARLEVEAKSLAIAQGLADAMLDGHRVAQKMAGEMVRPGPDPRLVDLPFPVLTAGYFTDFYIVPKSGFNDFAHFMGVSGAANLFVEIATPTFLHACCARVRTATDLELDFGGFHEPKPLGWFEDIAAVAIHPFKLSVFRDEETKAGFLAELDDIAQSRTVAQKSWRNKMTSPVADNRGAGWHGVEPWGFWAAEPNAVVLIPMENICSVKLKLMAPVHPDMPPMSGLLRYRDGSNRDQIISFRAEWPQTELQLEISSLAPDDDGVGRITLVSHTLIDPRQIGAHDVRRLGFGLAGCATLAEESDAPDQSP